MQVLKSYLRSLFAAVVGALGVVLTSDAAMSWQAVAVSVGVAVVPVVQRWLDPSDSLGRD